MMPKESTVNVPGEDCARFAALLPLVASGQLDETRLAKVTAHIAGCARCQQEMALHERLDGALRRVVNGTSGSAVLLSRQEIQRMRERVEGAVEAGGTSSTSKRAMHIGASGLFVGIPAIAAVVLLALFAGFVFHLGGGRTGLGPRKLSALPPNIDLTSISMVSASEGWAVGGTRPDPNYSPVHDSTPRPNYRDPVLAHYRDGEWSIMTLPAAVQSFSRHGISIVLNSISMASRDDGWAVGGSVIPQWAAGGSQGTGWVVDGMTIGVLLHYSHGTWTFAAGGTSDTPVFTQVQMRSATDGWAVAGGTIFHYDGNVWRQVQDVALTNIGVEALALASGGEIWARGANYGFSGGTGFDGDAPSVFLHFDGSRWSRVASPLSRVRISSIEMKSAGEGWAVGMLSGDATTPYNALILHYHDGMWEEQARFPGPVDASGSTVYTFNRVLATSDGQGWAVGTMGLMAHSGRDGWELLPSVGNAALYDIAFVSPSEGWAVGERGTVLHYVDGRWKMYGA